LPTATRRVDVDPKTAPRGAEIQTALTDPVQANIMDFDPRKQTSGGRHQIGTLAGFKSESWPASVLELLAGFVGIRSCALAAKLDAARNPSCRPPQLLTMLPTSKANRTA
jgi:hypothetical protein